MKRPWDASYARGVSLEKTGCSLPYLNALPGRERSHLCNLYISAIDGYVESYAVDWGTSTGYIIALRVGTDLPRSAIITSFDVVPPWPNHEIEWGYDSEDVLPQRKLKDFDGLLKSRLPSILNERELLYRGRPVQGLLCGRAWAPIPASCQRERPAMAEITVFNDAGAPARTLIYLTIITAIAKHSEDESPRCPGDWSPSPKHRKKAPTNNLLDEQDQLALEEVKELVSSRRFRHIAP